MSLPLIIILVLAFLITVSMGTLYLVSRVTALSLPHAYLKAKDESAKALAIVISGPAGWVGFDHRLSEILATAKMDVLGIDFLRYFFWKKKTPQLLADDLTKMIREWSAGRSDAKVVLIGYSKGADVLPFAANLLDEETKAKVQLVSLVSVSRLANFNFGLSNLLMGGYGPFALKVGPEIKKLESIPGLCVYGNRDLVSLARNLKSVANMEVREVQGGHMFHDAKPVADMILRKFEKVSTGYTNKMSDSSSRDVGLREFRDVRT